MAKAVFVSDDPREEAPYRELLRAWDAHTAFEPCLRSPTVAIDSTDQEDESGSMYACYRW
jgi:hypothetical protein